MALNTSKCNCMMTLGFAMQRRTQQYGAQLRELTSSHDAVKDGLVDVSGGWRTVPPFVLELELTFEQAELSAEPHRQQSARTVTADTQLIGDKSRQRAAQWRHLSLIHI